MWAERPNERKREERKWENESGKWAGEWVNLWTHLWECFPNYIKVSIHEKHWNVLSERFIKQEKMLKRNKI